MSSTVNGLSGPQKTAARVFTSSRGVTAERQLRATAATTVLPQTLAGTPASASVTAAHVVTVDTF